MYAQVSKETYYRSKRGLTLLAYLGIRKIWGSSCMHNILSVKRDLQVSKETYKCQKRPTSVKRGLLVSKETYYSSKRGLQLLAYFRPYASVSESLNPQT